MIKTFETSAMFVGSCIALAVTVYEMTSPSGDPVLAILGGVAAVVWFGVTLHWVCDLVVDRICDVVDTVAVVLGGDDRDEG